MGAVSLTALTKQELRQRLFIESYVEKADGRAAAIAAGFLPHNASAAASKLLANPGVALAIRIVQERLVEKFAVTTERVIGELARIAFSNISDLMSIDDDGIPYYDLSRATRDQLAAVEKIITSSRWPEEWELTDEERESGRRKKRRQLVDVIRYSKRDTLLDLGKHLNLFGAELNGVNVNVNTQVNNGDGPNSAPPTIVQFVDTAEDGSIVLLEGHPTALTSGPGVFPPASEVSVPLSPGKV